MIFEICVEGIDGVVAAQEGGGDRVELCASLLEGGITPSFGTIRAALKLAYIPIHVILRPRGGDFLYSDAEFATMLDDARAVARLGAAGIVIGCLTADGRIDEERMTALIEAAQPLSVTCHRAFDMTRDPEAALEALIRCGVQRVLTSGQRATAVEAIPLLKRLNDQASGRIIIMACGELGPDTIAQVVRETGGREFHFAALKTIPSDMAYRNPSVGMGGTALDREYSVTVTDPELIRATIAACRVAG
ncbi:MAG TPA: copper homeostasis protein CutC [Candidatus Cybelea sp.]|nr:copper homeostasis protein CutC [Candidatus Cybelea sp.]